MISVPEIKTLIQHRIDYWEGVCEKHYDEPRTISEQVIFDKGQIIGEEKGILNAFYHVMGFIDGQRK